MVLKLSLSSADAVVTRHRKTPYDLVIFDLDGTIIDSNTSMSLAFERAFRRIYPTAREVPLRELKMRQGIPFPEIVRELGWSQDLSGAFKEESLAQMDKVHLFPNMNAVLKLLRESDIKLAILTGKDRQRTLALLERFSLMDLFSVIVCGDDPFRGKPFPDGLEHIVNVTYSRRERCVFIGDAPNDMAAAQNAGIDFIGVRWAEQPDYLSEAKDIPVLYTPYGIINSLNIPTP